MSDKFIHHECFSAYTADADGGSGKFDVIEDDHGIYVTSANDGTLGFFDSVEEASKDAERRADQYDKDKWLLKWHAAVVMDGELRGFWEWIKEEHAS